MFLPGQAIPEAMQRANPESLKRIVLPGSLDGGAGLLDWKSVRVQRKTNDENDHMRVQGLAQGVCRYSRLYKRHGIRDKLVKCN